MTSSLPVNWRGPVAVTVAVLAFVLITSFFCSCSTPSEQTPPQQETCNFLRPGPYTLHARTTQAGCRPDVDIPGDFDQNGAEYGDCPTVHEPWLECSSVVTYTTCPDGFALVYDLDFSGPSPVGTVDVTLSTGMCRYAVTYGP